MFRRPNEDALHATADRLPDLECDLMRAGRDAIDRYDAAIIGDDEEAAEAARALYETVVWKLNGRSFFGSAGGDESAAGRLAAYCAAHPGQPGKWGQACQFVVKAKNVEAILASKGGFFLGGSYGWHVLPNRMDEPFFSETGFLSSTSPQVIYQATLPQAAEIWLASILAGKKPAVMPADAFVRKRPDAWPWLNAPAPKIGVEGGLMAFPF